MPTLLKVELALVPTVVMAARHTTMMSANMTAYSTAVGPSSFFRNRTIFWVRLHMTVAPGTLILRAYLKFAAARKT